MKFPRISKGRQTIWVVLFIAGCAGMLTASMWGQTAAGQGSAGPAKKLPEFEVASIRLSKQNGTSWQTYPGGRVVGVQPVVTLIRLAYEVRRDQIEDMPAWGKSDLYAIKAIPPKSSQSSRLKYRTIFPREEEREMLQSLLITRFHLKFHREFRNERAYLLSLKANSVEVKLKPPKDDTAPPFVSMHPYGLKSGSMGLIATNCSMSMFARQVGVFTKLNIVNRTGLAGSFDFIVPFYISQEEEDADLGASVLTGLGTFGFKVKSVKMPIEHIVIDHIERPSPN